MSSLKRGLELVKATFKDFSDDEATWKATALAYYRRDHGSIEPEEGAIRVVERTEMVRESSSPASSPERVQRRQLRKGS